VEVLPSERWLGHGAGRLRLVHLLAGRDEARQCFVRQWLQFALDRTQLVMTSVPDDQRTSVDQALAEFVRSGFGLRELVVGVTGTDAFVRR
jgi:hypothetical protein